jgi:hypothetical protein
VPACEPRSPPPSPATRQELVRRARDGVLHGRGREENRPRVQAPLTFCLCSSLFACCGFHTLSGNHEALGFVHHPASGLAAMQMRSPGATVACAALAVQRVGNLSGPFQRLAFRLPRRFPGSTQGLAELTQSIRPPRFTIGCAARMLEGRAAFAWGWFVYRLSPRLRHCASFQSSSPFLRPTCRRLEPCVSECFCATSR